MFHRAVLCQVLRRRHDRVCPGAGGVFRRERRVGRSDPLVQEGSEEASPQPRDQVRGANGA
eukprot:1800979-Alexandrium_andersonii.AAC.1